MSHQAVNKKDVSCKALDPLFYYARHHHIDLKDLIAGVPYELSYLLKKRERIEWGVWCRIMANARNYFPLREFEEIGSRFIKSGHFLVGMLPAFFLFTSNKLTRILARLIYRSNNSMFGCITVRIEFIDVNKVRITVLINEGYEFCPEFFFISKGYWGGLGRKLGHKNFNFLMDLKYTKGIFEASWDKESLLFRVKRVLRWLFNIRKALVEVTEAHEELFNEYEYLQVSKKILLKQTAQLRIAHEILMSIKQGHQLNETIKTIINALINETGFKAVAIELKKDLSDKELDIRYQPAAVTEDTASVYRDIIINDKKIGSICFNVKSEMNFMEIDELLDYIIPLVNIVIHDALVLREVTDYRERLEQMVSERTNELVKAKDELDETNKLLQQANRTQNIFFTNISHEFRTPLTLILGPAKQLLDRVKDTNIRENLEIIHRSARKLNKLVDELLDISKIEAGEMKLKTCPLNFISVVKEIIPPYYSYAERKKIDFKLSYDEEEIIIYLDKDKSDKILNNIFANAFKFTPEGGKIEVKVRLAEGCAEVSVADTGVGIPIDQIDKIFDRFYQVDGSHSREQDGTGIGLSLTKELIELHKAKIEVESQEGKGSTFIIRFPLGKEHLKPEEISEDKIYEINKPEHEDAGREKISTVKDKVLVTTNLPLLLIIEDNADVRFYIKDNLKKDYLIEEAEDGEAGWNESLERFPDLIISDVMMPKMDGFKLCEKLKNDERTSHIPIILLTARAAKADKLEGYETGADDYIMKPFEPDELKARINNLIEQRKRIHEHFKKHGLFELTFTQITPLDRKFMQKVYETINNHISEQSFSLDSFAGYLNISKSLLHKKITALAGEPPGELIRRIRIKKAAELIENKFGNLSEIAFEVGFNNPAYFSECFKKQFGVTPSHYLKEKRN